ncbi:recombinase family protein [Streptomyces rimosus]|uniref:recombinase family protein n=1 Tax=Streptomyces rimosus TaxID=1927 RepID=UPI0006B2A50E|nr:recombinase family protein [Streptomyces rimosus]
MAKLVYKRGSTCQQSTAQQNLVLDKAGIEDPVVFEEDGGTSSRLRPLQRPKFRTLLECARPGDTAHISQMYRLVRGTGHILDVLDVLHRDLQRELTYDGLRAAKAKGSKGGRRPAVAATKTADVCTAYLKGRSIAALARELQSAAARSVPRHRSPLRAPPRSAGPLAT